MLSESLQKRLNIAQSELKRQWNKINQFPLSYSLYLLTRSRSSSIYENSVLKQNGKTLCPNAMLERNRLPLLVYDKPYPNALVLLAERAWGAIIGLLNTLEMGAV